MKVKLFQPYATFTQAFKTMLKSQVHKYVIRYKPRRTLETLESLRKWVSCAFIR